MSGPDGTHTDPSPEWLMQAVAESCKSEQWNRLLHTVNDRIQTHISSFDLPLFSDMDEATQSAIVEREFKELVKLKSPGLYHYSGTLNAAVDEALLARLRGQTSALQYNVDHLTNICTTAVKDILLNSPPDMASASRIFINRPLPRSLRPFIWSNAFGFNSTQGVVHRNYVSRMSPLLEVLLSRRCQKILDRFFVKISTRASAALVKTVVANFMKNHEMSLPIDEDQCAVGTAFDHLVFLAIPIMAVLRMFSPSGGNSAAFMSQSAPAPTVQTQFSEDSAISRSDEDAVGGESYHGNDSDVKLAVMTAVAGLASMTSQRHLKVWEKAGSIALVSSFVDSTKVLLRKKHVDFESHLNHLASDHKLEISSTLHAHSVYLSLYLPSVRTREEKRNLSSTENGFFDYINFCLLRSFSGSSSPEVAVFIMDQCIILGFSVILPLVACALLLGASGELLSLENCDTAVECFDSFCRAITVGKLRRLLSAFCGEELTNLYDDEGAYRLLTNDDDILETMYNKLLPQYEPTPPAVVENQDEGENTVFPANGSVVDGVVADTEDPTQSAMSTLLNERPVLSSDSDGNMSDGSVETPPNPEVLPLLPDVTPDETGDIDNEVPNDDRSVATPAEISASQDVLSAS